VVLKNETEPRLCDRILKRSEDEPNGGVGASLAYSETQLANALVLAHRGLAIFPCYEPVTYGDQVECSCKEHEKCSHIGKHPRTRQGFKDASKDPDQLKRWWRESPNANPAIATGDASNLLVLDADDPAIAEKWIKEQADNGYHLLDTLKVITSKAADGSDKFHLYFQMPACHVPSTVKGKKSPIPGFDIRANGGYVSTALKT
jgi:hypothetical protein